MTPEVPDPLELWKQLAAVVGAGVMSAFLAWRARGRKDLRAPYSPEKGAQPRVITRDEWHGAVQIINAWPGLSSKVRGIDGRLQAVEGDFAEHLRKSNDTMESFTRLEAAFNAHVKAWGEAGQRAIEDRKEVKEDLRSLSQKVDALAAEIRRR